MLLCQGGSVALLCPWTCYGLLGLYVGGSCGEVVFYGLRGLAACAQG